MQKLILCILIFFSAQGYSQTISVGAGFLYPHFYWTKKDQRIREANYSQYGAELYVTTQVKKLNCILGYRLLQQNLTETVDHEPPSWAVYKYIYSRKIQGLFMGLGTQVFQYKKVEISYQTGVVAYQSYQTHFIGKTTQEQFIDTIYKSPDYDNSWGQFQKITVGYKVSERINVNLGGLFEFRFNPFKDLPKYVFIKQDSRMMHGFTFNIQYKIKK